MGQCGCQLHKGKGQRALTMVPGKEDPWWEWRRENRKTEKHCLCNRCWDGPTFVVMCQKRCVSKCIAILLESQCCNENQSCNENQCWKATELPNVPERVQSTSVNHRLLIIPRDGQPSSMRCFFSRLQAEPRCSAAFPSPRFSCNICPCKLNLTAFWIRYLHILTPDLLDLSCCLAPGS